MSVCPAIYVLSLNKIVKVDKIVLGFASLLFTISIVFNFNSIKWSSLMFSCMFLLYFLSGVHCAYRGKVGWTEICWICKTIIYAYCIVLIVQQICVLFGLPVFNANNYSANEPWKLNALSAEPSHTSRYIGVLMYSFLVSNDKIANRNIAFSESFRTNRNIWLSFLWIMLSTVSGTAMIIVALLMTIYINKKNAIIYASLILIVLALGVTSDITALRRSTSFLSAAMTGNNESMIEADHSASVRIVPWILCLGRLNVFSFKSWVGEGAGSTSLWMSDFMPGVTKGWSGGGIANLMVEYGLIIGIYYLIFTFRCCYNRSHKICSIGLWIMCVVLLGINMQIAWLCILMLYLDNNIRVGHENKSILQFT